MPAYIITTRKGPIKDAEAMAEYQRRTRAMGRHPTLTPLVVYGATEVLEGDAPDGTIIMQFPSIEDARAWYNLPAYQEAIPYRQKAADYDMYIVEGLEPA